MGLVVGDQIPLQCQLADYAEDKFVRAYVEDSDGQAIAGSPFDLTPGDNGIYSSDAAVFPNKPWVHATYLVFDDADYETLSVTHGGSAETYYGEFQAGDPLPLYDQLATYDPTQFVRAFVTDPAGDPIAGSPFNLDAADDTGNYKNLFGEMPDEPWVKAQYLVYSDSSYTTLSGSAGGFSEAIYPTEASDPAQVPPANVVANVQGECCGELSPIEDTIVQGSDKTLYIRLAGKDGQPFNLEGASMVEFRMRKTDGTVLSVDTDGTVVVQNAGGGQIAVTLSDEQTAVLNPGVPAPATIKVTISSRVTIVNIPTQIAVEEEAVDAAV